MPPDAAASVVSSPAAPPVAVTWASWPGKTIDVGSGSELVRLTTTVSPSLAHRTGPGLWKCPLSGASPLA